MELPKHLATALTAAFVTAGLLICSSVQAKAEFKALSLTPGFAQMPEMTGRSGGASETPDCGYIKATPDYVVTLTKPFTALRASVQSAGDVTLLIEGPNGRICSDDVNDLMPEVSGAAPAGTYRVWVGDYVGQADGGFDYQLTFQEDQ
jgi:hypothetical protein